MGTPQFKAERAIMSNVRLINWTNSRPIQRPVTTNVTPTATSLTPKGSVWSCICISAWISDVRTPTITATISGGAVSTTTSSMPCLNSTIGSIGSSEIGKEQAVQQPRPAGHHHQQQKFKRQGNG